MSNALTLNSDPAVFEHAQRVAKVYASSELIPPHLRGKLADVVIALAMAEAMGENPLVVMQNIYVVSGRAGWSAQYLIARANKSGVFRGRINWRVKGAGKDMEVQAYAVLADTGEEVSMSTSMAMAEAEGWTKNPKYRTMPEVMLRYRSATLLVRMYAGDVMLGYPAAEELETAPAPEAVVVQAAPRRASSLASRLQIAEAPPVEIDAAAPEREYAPTVSADDEGV